MQTNQCSTGKISYVNAQEAYRVIARLATPTRRKSAKRHKPARAYRCRECDCYHLTSSM